MTKIAKSTAGDHPRHIRNARGTALIGAAAALVAVAAFAAPASAKPFQQFQNGICVDKTCKVTFAKVPAGQRLDVNNASCYVRMAVPGELPVVATQLTVLGEDPTKIVNAVTLVTNLTGAHGDQIVLSSNDAISAFALPQQRFQALIAIYEGQVFELRCSIGGDMVKLSAAQQ